MDQVQLVHPAQLAAMARDMVHKRYGIRNPPAWLMCAVTHIPYIIPMLPPQHVTRWL